MGWDQGFTDNTKLDPLNRFFMRDELSRNFLSQKQDILKKLRFLKCLNAKKF